MRKRRTRRWTGEESAEERWRGLVRATLSGIRLESHEETAARLASEGSLICGLGRREALVLAASEVRLVARELSELASSLMQFARSEGEA